MFAEDRRRLRDGARAMAWPAEPTTLSEIEVALGVLHDGMVALQSTDDLGSEAANEAAWEDMKTLQARSEVLEARKKTLQTEGAS